MKTKSVAKSQSHRGNVKSKMIPEKLRNSRKLGVNRMQKLCEVAGLEVDYEELFEGHDTEEFKLFTMVSLLQEEGINGIPNVRKCRALKRKRDQMRKEEEQRMRQNEECEPRYSFGRLEREKSEFMIEPRGQKRKQGRQGRKQRGRESDQCEQEIEQTEQEREQSDQEIEQSDLEREHSVQASDQCKQEMKQSEQQGEQSEQYIEQVEQERQQSDQEMEQSDQSDLEDEQSWRKRLLSYDERLQTFGKWPADHPISPQALAEAGFSVFEGFEADQVDCSVCGLMLYDWAAGDDPWVEHAMRYPPCNFMMEETGLLFIEKHRIMDRSFTKGKPLTINPLLKYCRAAGLQFNYPNLVRGCVTYKDRTDKLLALLKEAGLEGEPNMKKCKALRKKKREEEVLHRQKTEWCRQEREQSGEEGRQRGQEREQSGQERGQRVQESEQSGQESGQLGQESEQSGQERGQLGQESEQSGQERGQRGQEREQSGQERGQRGLEREQSGEERKQNKQERGQCGQEREQSAQEREQSAQERGQRWQEREQSGQERGQRGQEREQSGHEREQSGQQKGQRWQEIEQSGQERGQRGQEREQSGHEREQSGQERGQRWQERDQSGQERGRPGQEREQSGQERNQPEQERRQRGREREQSGQEKGQRGQEREQSGQEREQRGQEREQSGQERGQRGQEREQSGHERGQRGQEREQSGPDRDQRGHNREDREQERDQSGQEGGQRGRKNQANRRKIIQVKKNLPESKLDDCSIQIIDDPERERKREILQSTLTHMAALARNCIDLSIGSLLNGVSHLPHGLWLGNLLKRQADEIKTVPAKKEKMLCEECDKVYISKYFFQLHMSKHVSSYNCEECGEIFDTQSSVSKHRKSCGKRRASAKKDHQKTYRKDEVVCNLQSAPPQQWCSENSGYREANQEERSLRKADSVQETNAAQLGGIQGSSRNNSNQEHCKLCFSEGPFDFEKHYLEEHNIPDPLSMLCSDCTFLVLKDNTSTATKHLSDASWWCDQFAKAMKRYTGTVCRLCDVDLASFDLSILNNHYAKHHKVDSDLLYVINRLLREDSATAQTSQHWRG